MFWSDARKNGLRGSKQYISRDKRTRGHNNPTDGETDGHDNIPIAGEMDGDGLQLELQGTMMTTELHGNEMAQQI